MMRERGINRAQTMRDQALSVAMKRKEEFLGARVPKELRDKVTARANEQGIPVSILIRNILEDAFKNHPNLAYSARGGEPLQGMVAPGILPPAPCMDAQEQLPTTLTEPFAGALPCVTAVPVHPAPTALTHPCVTRFPAVLGWEMIRLNRQVDCSSCGKQLLPGASVTLGVANDLGAGLAQVGAAHIILCDQCQGWM